MYKDDHVNHFDGGVLGARRVHKRGIRCSLGYGDGGYESLAYKVATEQETEQGGWHGGDYLNQREKCM